MKLYTIIGGVNGCGKSSLTGALKAERSDLGLIIDVDKLAAQLHSPVEGGKAAVRCRDRPSKGRTAEVDRPSLRTALADGYRACHKYNHDT